MKVVWNLLALLHGKGKPPFPAEEKTKRRAALTGGAPPLRKNTILILTQTKRELSQLTYHDVLVTNGTQKTTISMAKVARRQRPPKDSSRRQKSLV